MTRTLTAALVMAASAVVLDGCAADARPEGYDAAAYAARRNFKSPQGARYGRLVMKQVGASFQDAIRKCYHRIPDSRGAKFLYRLDAEGIPVESLAYPQSDFSACVVNSVGSFRVTPPPRPDYWIGILAPAKRELSGFWGGG